MNTENARVSNTGEQQEQAEEGFLPEFESAIKLKAVSFTQVAQAYFYRQEKFNKDFASRSLYEKYFPQLLEVFVSRHGAIVKSYHCSSDISAVVLTDKDEIYVVHGKGIQALDLKFLNQCQWLHTEATQFLRGQDRRICAEMIYAIIANVISILDVRQEKTGKPKGSDRSSQTLGVLKDELEHAKGYFKRSVQRDSQSDYFHGMLRGISFLAFVASLGWLLLCNSTCDSALKSLQGSFIEWLLSCNRTALKSLLGSFIFGGVGAVVSVMTRMTGRDFMLDYEAGPKLLTLLGAFRPIIGSVFGVVLYFLIMSKILPIDIPAESKQFYFFVSIAFLAGFNERWAQDMLAVTESRITGVIKQKGKQPMPKKPTKSSGATK